MAFSPRLSVLWTGSELIDALGSRNDWRDLAKNHVLWRDAGDTNEESLHALNQKIHDSRSYLGSVVILNSD